MAHSHPTHRHKHVHACEHVRAHTQMHTHTCIGREGREREEERERNRERGTWREGESVGGRKGGAYVSTVIDIQRYISLKIWPAIISLYITMPTFISCP